VHHQASLESSDYYQQLLLLLLQHIDGARPLAEWCAISPPVTV